MAAPPARAQSRPSGSVIVSDGKAVAVLSAFGEAYRSTFEIARFVLLTRNGKRLLEKENSWTLSAVVPPCVRRYHSVGNSCLRLKSRAAPKSWVADLIALTADFKSASATAFSPASLLA